tara:strand:- start:1031 stop:1222 length:192 start_codon:yes stop_codon:yes gene_type:complete
VNQNTRKAASFWSSKSNQQDQERLENIVFIYFQLSKSFFAAGSHLTEMVPSSFFHFPRAMLAS